MLAGGERGSDENEKVGVAVFDGRREDVDLFA